MVRKLTIHFAAELRLCNSLFRMYNIIIALSARAGNTAVEEQANLLPMQIKIQVMTQRIAT